MVVPAPNLSDRALQDYKLVLEALNEKSEKAFSELMHRYKDSIYYMLLKMVNNKDDADDLTIEAFGKAFRKLHQYTPNYAFSTWLFKIATNNCIDFLRRKKANTFSLSQNFTNDDNDELQIDIKSEALNPEETIMKEQKIDMMRKVVSSLKPRYRQLVELRYFQELSYDEIADEMKIPLGTVKAQLFRAREFLLQMMNEQDSEY
jgi:RNA polymerase sigma-70 factor (ECF subfamily)